MWRLVFLSILFIVFTPQNLEASGLCLPIHELIKTNTHWDEIRFLDTLSVDELADLSRHYEKLNTEEELEQLARFVEYISRHKQSSQRSMAIHEFMEKSATLSDSGARFDSSYLAKFAKSEKKFSQLEGRYLLKEVEKLTLAGKTKRATEALLRKAERAARRRAGHHNSVVNACQVAGKNAHKTRAAFSLGKLYFGVGAITTSYAFATNNTEIAGANKEFGIKLGSELAIPIILDYIFKGPFSKIVGSSHSAFSKNFEFLGLKLVRYGIQAPVFTYLYGYSEEEAKRKAQEFHDDPEMLRQAQMLQDSIALYFEENPDKEEELIKSFYTTDKMFEKMTKMEIKFGDLSEFSQTEEGREKIAEYLIAEHIEDNSSFTDKTFKRWLFDSKWATLLAIFPKGLIIDLFSMKLLCTGQFNPKWAYAKVLALIGVNRLIFDNIYFSWRKKELGK